MKIQCKYQGICKRTSDLWSNVKQQISVVMLLLELLSSLVIDNHTSNKCVYLYIDGVTQYKRSIP